MKKTVVLIAAFSGILFAACTKTTAPGPSTTEQMLVGKWRKTYDKTFSLTNGNIESETDSLALTDSCAKDDLLDLRADQAYYMDQGDSLCFFFTPKEIYRGNWKLGNNETELVLNIDSPASSSKSRILELTASTLRLYADSTFTQGSESISTKRLTTYEKK